MSKPKPYSWNGIVESLIDVILYFKPDTIIATDYDTHVDHRLCALTVESAMEWIIKHTEFRPQLLKGFAYATGYETIDDYYNNHLLSTLINKKHYHLMNLVQGIQLYLDTSSKNFCS